MGSVLDDRKRETDKRLADLKGRLTETEKRLEKKACIYVTGSFGRGEASKYSDLDVFVVGREDTPRGLSALKELVEKATPVVAKVEAALARGQDIKPQDLYPIQQLCENLEAPRALSHLDEILVEATLIEESRRLRLPEFSGDGKYLEHCTVRQLCGKLGTPEDDAVNTFTSRLLLLLESQSLVGEAVYRSIIEEVVAAYWRDYEEHKDKFRPTFLTNDILRLWRTFCVNYEARTETDPEEKRAKRKLHNYKLKHSRLLTCYSGLLYLAAVYVKQKTVHRTDAIKMTELSPTQRLDWLKTNGAAPAEAVNKLLNAYEKFLVETARPKEELIGLFLDPEKARTYVDDATIFGDLIFKLLEDVAGGSPFYRFLMI